MSRPPVSVAGANLLEGVLGMPKKTWIIFLVITCTTVEARKDAEHSMCFVMGLLVVGICATVGCFGVCVGVSPPWLVRCESS